MTVAVADIEAAERLLGIAYTAAERAQMAGTLDVQRGWAEARRRLTFAGRPPDGLHLRLAAGRLTAAGDNASGITR